MHTDAACEESPPTSRRLCARQDIAPIAVLAAICLGVGIYLIVTTVVVSQDSVTFIEYAQDLKTAGFETMKQQAQHPGYPYLILAAHRISECFADGAGPSGWIHSAQAAALLFRLSAVIMIYLLGKILVGRRSAFAAVLILILLPYPAKYGSDALSDWPHLFFLVGGLLFLLRGAMHGKWWLFGAAGICSGAGYLIRPECAQIVVYGVVWLGTQLPLRKRVMSQGKVLLALAALLVGFGAVASPYMHLKGALFPKKDMGEFAAKSEIPDYCQSKPRPGSETVQTAGVLEWHTARGVVKLVGNVGDTVMWFFLPAVFAGLYDYLKKRSWLRPEQFFVIAWLATNVALVMWLYSKHSYMSNRHTLPMVVLLCLFIPGGLRVLSSLLCSRGGARNKSEQARQDCERTAFLLLLATGILICTPKLLRPLHHDRGYIREAARWLAEHTEASDIVAVADFRISFYCEREAVLHDGHTFSAKARYMVVKNGVTVSAEGSTPQIEATISDEGGKSKAIIYGRAR